MLPRLHRLADPAAIRRTLARGRRCWRPLLGLRAASNGTPQSRFAFVVSTKVSKRAVERNRIRRHLREEIRHLLPQLAGGHDVAVIVTPAAKGASGPLLRQQLAEAAVRLGLLRVGNPNDQ